MPMKLKKAITARQSVKPRNMRTLGSLLKAHLSDHGSATRIAERAGITLSYLSRMKHDMVFSVSEPIKRTLSDALGINIKALSEAITATEKQYNRALVKNREQA